MRVYYNTAGEITFTLSAEDYTAFANLADSYIEVDGPPIDQTSFAVVDGKLVAKTAMTEAFILEQEGLVNGVVGRARALFITPIPGQEMTYLAKQTEARELLAMAAEPEDPSIFPFLYKEVGLTGPTITAVAQVVLNLAYQWSIVGSELERVRMNANSQIRRAVDRDTAKIVAPTATATVNAMLNSMGFGDV